MIRFRGPALGLVVVAALGMAPKAHAVQLPAAAESNAAESSAAESNAAARQAGAEASTADDPSETDVRRRRRIKRHTVRPSGSVEVQRPERQRPERQRPERRRERTLRARPFAKSTGRTRKLADKRPVPVREKENHLHLHGSFELNLGNEIVIAGEGRIAIEFDQAAVAKLREGIGKGIEEAAPVAGEVLRIVETLSRTAESTRRILELLADPGTQKYMTQVEQVLQWLPKPPARPDPSN